MKRKGRVSMNRHEQILEMQRGGYGVRAISKTLKMCRKTVRKYLLLPSALKTQMRPFTSEVSIDNPATLINRNAEFFKVCPDWFRNLDTEHLLCELQKGVSYRILFSEMQLKDVKYWTFWKWAKSFLSVSNPKHPKVTVRLAHKPGEKTFVDYTDGLEFVNCETGEIVKTQLFVGTLPFSSMVFAEFTLSQKLESFICSHERMWSYFGGVTKYVVPDNLRSAVSRAHLFDPDVNKTFCDYANHAGFAVLPARPRKPKDKANVECHAGLLQRLFYEEVRHHHFGSLAELNKALKVFLEKLNNSKMKDHGVSRLERFEAEKPFLKAVPKFLYEIPIVKEAKVHPDCHIQFLGNFYSVPFIHVGKQVNVVLAKGQVQIYCLLSLDKIATHTEAIGKHKYKTNDLHYPPQQADCKNFSIEIALRDAAKIGAETKKLFTAMFATKFPLKFLRPAQGIIRLAKTSELSIDAIEYAATQACQHGQYKVAYFEHCARFFSKGLLESNRKTETPKRNPAEYFLQSNTINKPEEIKP